MKAYAAMEREELQSVYEGLRQEYKAFQEQKLTLNMSRGVPGADQLELSDAMLGDVSVFAEDGTDCRNYGGMDGLPEMKKLFADLLGVEPENVLVGGNSSLNMMFDKIATAMTHGICGGTPWMLQEKVKFLCPAPGYDRHFGVTEHFGIEMIPVAMTPDGPDMDAVERLVAEDAAIKGIWCVPKYSNPQGYVYSDETVRRFANLKPAAKDFRIFWDNAYFVHDLTEETVEILNIMEECKKAGNEDMVYEFVSTSKISYPGAGVAAMIASVNNLTWEKKRVTMQTIGPDKLNQLRHVKFFKDKAGVMEQMKKHRALLRPKFDVVLSKLEKELSGLEILSWNNPKGGYFVSVDTLEGCAKRVVELCKEAGVQLTGAGATYPYKKDPADTNIRIAPSFPTIDKLEKAMTLFCLCVKLASAEKILGK